LKLQHQDIVMLEHQLTGSKGFDTDSLHDYIDTFMRNSNVIKQTFYEKDFEVI